MARISPGEGDIQTRYLLLQGSADVISWLGPRGPRLSVGFWMHVPTRPLHSYQILLISLSCWQLIQKKPGTKPCIYFYHLYRYKDHPWYQTWVNFFYRLIRKKSCLVMTWWYKRFTLNLLRKLMNESLEREKKMVVRLVLGQSPS